LLNKSKSSYVIIVKIEFATTKNRKGSQKFKCPLRGFVVHTIVLAMINLFTKSEDSGFIHSKDMKTQNLKTGDL